MIPIQELINKIHWDKREKPEEYTLFYFDRILNKLISLPYTKIKRLEGSFMIIDNEEETNIPKFYQVHLGTKDYGNENTSTRILPFSQFCKDETL